MTRCRAFLVSSADKAKGAAAEGRCGGLRAGDVAVVFASPPDASAAPSILTRGLSPSRGAASLCAAMGRLAADCVGASRSRLSVGWGATAGLVEPPRCQSISKCPQRLGQSGPFAIAVGSEHQSERVEESASPLRSLRPHPGGVDRHVRSLALDDFQECRFCRLEGASFTADGWRKVRSASVSA